MMFSGDKDFDDDFFPNPKYQTNLASIFSNSTSGDDNPSLTYTPPKQPKRQNKLPTSTTTASTSSASSVICAKTVQTFKMVDGAYQSQGKVGAAVISIRSEDGMVYQLLLYRDKKNHLCNAKITREFKFHIQPKNYCTFYDRQNIIWSILFDNPADMAEFNLQVAKCRWNAEEGKSPILIQDLWCPIPSDDVSKISAAVGDTVEFTYTLQTINSTLQEIEESKSAEVEVESSGWKQALVGVQMNSQKVVILQPFMLGDLNPNEVVYNSPVIVKITVLQVSKAIQTLSKTEPLSEENRNIVHDMPRPQSAPEDTITDSPRSPKTSKAELINRMARMGQALPFKKPIPTPSDSDETEEDHKAPVHRFGKIVPKPRARAQHTVTTPAPLETVGEPSSAVPHMPIAQQVPLQWAPGIASPYMVGSMYPVPQASSPLEVQPQFNMFLSEVRTTNSELRMGITRLTDKIDALQTKIEDSSVKKPKNDNLTSVVERLVEEEHQVKDQLQQVLSVLQNIQLTRQTQETSPSQVDRLSSTSTNTVVEPCQQCADLHQAHTSLSEKMKKLEEENQLLQISLTAQKDALQNAKMADKDQMSRIETLQRQLSEEQRSVSELNQSLENLQRVKEILVEDLQTANISITELQDTLREKQTSIDRLEQALKDSEATKLEEVRRNLQEVLDPKPVIGEHIKKILNTVYRLVKIQFEPQSKYDASFIQSVLAETIKGVTLEYLENGELFLSDSQPQVLGSSQTSTPIPTVQSNTTNTNPSTSSEQPMVEETKVHYMNRDERNISDTESQTCVATSPAVSVISSQGSVQASTDCPSNTTIVNKEEEGHVESNSMVPSIKIPLLSQSKIHSEATLAVSESAEESSDDDNKSIISLKLQTVLLHLSQSQSKIPNTPSTSFTHLWNPPPNWNTYHE